MNIYHNIRINQPERANLPLDTMELPYTIISAQIMEKGYAGVDVLQIGLQEQDKKGTLLGYNLIGEEVFKPFMKEMNSDNDNGLVGKVILAFVPPSKDHIRGISPRA